MASTKKGGDKPKAAAKSDPQPEGQPICDKSNILNEDQLRALFFNHKKLYEGALAAKKKTDADFKNACKLIKSEGGSVDDIKLAIRLDTPEGEKAAQADIEHQLQVARWVGAQFGHQFSLLPEPAAVDRAFDAGKIAGLKGVPRKPPHDPSVPQYKRWMEGFDEGQAVLVRKFTPPKDAAKAPPPDDAKAAKPSGAGGLEGQPQNENVVPIKGDQKVEAPSDA